MSTIKVIRAYDPYEDNRPAFSVVADDKSAEFVFPDDAEMFDSESRMKFLLDTTGKKPDSADSWLNLAISGFNTFDFVPLEGVEYENSKDAVSGERKFFAEEEKEYSDSSSSREEYAIQAAMTKLAQEDEEINAYVQDPDVGLSEEKRKRIMAVMIVAADTLDYNPWLLPWLNGEKLPEGMNTEPVLSKPSTAKLSNDHIPVSNNEEGVTE